MSALATYLQQERERRNWTIIEFAQRADLPDTTLSRILSGEVAEPKASQIARIAKALGIPFWTLMQIAGYTTETPGDPDEDTARVAALITADPGLKPIMDRVVNLSRQNRRSVLAYMELLIQQDGTQSLPED